MLLITKTYDQTRQRRLCVFVCQDRGRSYLDTPSHSPLGMPTESPLPRQQAHINRVIDLKKHKVTQLVLDMVGRSLGMSTFPVWKPNAFFSRSE